MKTPTSYIKMINKGEITREVLSEVLYSINKRAKNYRDAKRRYKNSYYESNYEKALEKEEEFYEMKDDILSLLNPTKIHKEIKSKISYVKYYDYEEEYYNIDKYERKGGYFDREIDNYVEFKVVAEIDEIELLFLYYELGEYNFHIPIKEKELKHYKELEIEVIRDLVTEGKDVSELLSSQFCTKVHRGLMNETINIVD